MFTGNGVADFSMIAGIAAIVGYLARHYGLTWLAAIADALARKKEDKPDVENQSPAVLLASATPADAKKVAIPLWLSFLFPLLLPLIQQLLTQLAQKLGREPTPAEKAEVAEKVWVSYVNGKIDVTLKE